MGREAIQEAVAEQQLYEAVIVNTPAKAGDELFVTIEAFDEGKHKFGPVVWNPIVLAGKEVLPEAGDLALVAKPSITGNVWLLAWR